MINSSHYRTHRALVQSETYEGRVARLVASNTQKLREHFRISGDRCATSYRAKKSNIRLPASESELEAEHKQLVSSVREMLDDQGTDLRDTDAYKMALRSLNNVLDEGYHQLCQKNVQIWKA